MKTDQENRRSLEMRVQFWGVRGSLASPGPRTAKFGGNTSSVEVTYGGQSLLFDAGTGIRSAGANLVAKGRTSIHLLFSHLHWDHIQGFPFFAPIYTPGCQVHVYGPAPKEELESSLARQMKPPNFPIIFEDLKSEIHLQEIHPERPYMIGKMRVTAARLNHPGGVLGYRVETPGGTVVYTTDHEHGTDADRRLVALARDADILIYDAMYTPEEYEGTSGTSKRGWGHSTYEEGARVAAAARVKKLVLFHHDPERSDEELDELVSRAQKCFGNIVAAQEGRSLSTKTSRPPSRRPEEKVA